MKEELNDRAKLLAIIETIKKVTGVDIANETRSRVRIVVDLRKIYGYIAKESTTLTLAEIGAPIKKDHASVLWYIKRTTEYLAFEKDFIRLYQEIRDNLEIDMPIFMLEHTYEYHKSMCEKYKKQLDDKKNAEV